MAKTRVLLIDDEEAFTELLKYNLEETGHYEVRVENRGFLAAAAARQFRPDIIFLDVIMPDLDGSRVAGQIQTDPLLKQTPIVYVTAILSKRDTHAPATVGGVGFIAKPVTTEEIVNCIQRYAGNGNHHAVVEPFPFGRREVNSNGGPVPQADSDR